MEFKNRLHKLRKEFNLTQKELGEKINLAESTISHYETGIRMPDTTSLKEFANFFKVTVDYLLGRTNTRKESPYPIIGTGNEKFDHYKNIPPEVREEAITGLHRTGGYIDEDVPDEVREEIERYANYLIEKHKKGEYKREGK